MQFSILVWVDRTMNAKDWILCGLKLWAWNKGPRENAIGYWS